MKRQKYFWDRIEVELIPTEEENAYEETIECNRRQTKLNTATRMLNSIERI